MILFESKLRSIGLIELTTSIIVVFSQTTCKHVLKKVTGFPNNTVLELPAVDKLPPKVPVLRHLIYAKLFYVFPFNLFSPTGGWKVPTAGVNNKGFGSAV